jgi:hypothetical protein
MRFRRLPRAFPIGEPRARLWTGRLHHLSGRPDGHSGPGGAGLSAARRLGMPFEAALAHLERGRPADGQPSTGLSQGIQVAYRWWDAA